MKRCMTVILSTMALVIVVLSATAHASYRSELNRATKGSRIYDLRNGNAKIIFKTTLFTDDFRRAFAEKDAEIHYLGPIDAAAVVAREETKQMNGWEVFVGMYTRKEYKKFSLEKDTFWESFLTTAHGETVSPTSIEKITITPYWKIMFPYINRWDRAYRVVFPKSALGNEVSFTLQSIEGQMTVTWKLK